MPLEPSPDEPAASPHGWRSFFTLVGMAAFLGFAAWLCLAIYEARQEAPPRDTPAATPPN